MEPLPLDGSESVAAVIVTYRRVEPLRRSLDVVASQTRPVDHIIVVDNGCEEAVRDAVEKIGGIYLPSHTNLGGGGGFAYGFLTALALGVGAVWCADDDGRPADEHVLATLFDVATRHRLHEVSPAVANIDDPARLAFPLRQGLTWKRRRDELTGDFLEGIASLFNGALISTGAMEIIGVPDYRLFIRGDEVEYHRRLVRSGLRFGTALTTCYLHPDGSDEFKPILGGCMHTQYPDDRTKRYFTYRNRGYLMSQPGMRRLIPQELARFGWFFLVQRRDPRGFAEWLRLQAQGRREGFQRPDDTASGAN